MTQLLIFYQPLQTYAHNLHKLAQKDMFSFLNDSSRYVLRAKPVQQAQTKTAQPVLVRVQPRLLHRQKRQLGAARLERVQTIQHNPGRAVGDPIIRLVQRGRVRLRLGLPRRNVPLHIQKRQPQTLEV